MKIELGQKVRDTITGMEGIAVGRTVWLNGCIRISVQSQMLKDGVPLDQQWIDEPQLQVVEETAAPEPEPRHGPRPDAGRAPDPTRR